MNTPGNVTNGSTNNLTINANPCVLLKLSVTNGGATPRVYVLVDATGTPGQSALGPTGRLQMIQSPAIPAGQTWSGPTAVSTPQGVVFGYGCYLQSFACDTYGNPIFTALSAADANVTAAWSAALQ